MNLVSRCYESFLKLDSTHDWRAIFISDGCPNTSYWLRKNVNHPRIQVLTHLENRGAAYCRYKAIHDAGLSEEDIVVLVGMDDEIMPWCLDEIDKHYKQGKWMTYGNWIDQHGKCLPPTFDLDFDQITHETRNYRKVKYRSTAINTFKYFLFKQFTEDDFKYKGEWVKATTESNLMISCLEMCGKERIGVVHRPIYLYNKGRPDNARRRFGNEYQDEIYTDVISRPMKELIQR